MKTFAIALALVMGVSLMAQTTPTTTIPVGTTMTITGIGSQNGSGNFKIGDLGGVLHSVGFAGGNQSTLGTMNFNITGTNASGGVGSITNQGVTSSIANQTGNGVTSSGSNAVGTLSNFVKVEISPLVGKLTDGLATDALKAGINISGNGAMQAGTQAILGTLTTATAADVAAALLVDPKSTLKVGDVTGFSNGGFSASNALGTFTFEGHGLPTSCGGNWVGGGNIISTGNSLVNALPNGFSTTSFGSTIVTVPVLPTTVIK